MRLLQLSIFTIMCLFVYYIGSKHVFYSCDSIFTPSLPSSNYFACFRQTIIKRDNASNDHFVNLKTRDIKFNLMDLLQLLVLCFGLLFLFWFLLLHLCTKVNYIEFNTNLNLYSKRKTLTANYIITLFLSTTVFFPVL